MMYKMGSAGRFFATAPLVSVIVPVCNVERYLAECLDALIAQTLHEIEIIAIDDGSTDSSLDILRHYEAIDERIRVIAKPNEGYGATINLGIAEARGGYIGIVESDDYPEPTMFQMLYETAQRFDADLVKCDFFDTFEDGEHIRHNLKALPHGVVIDAADYPQVMLITPSIWSALYRRDMLERAHIRCRTTPGAAFQDTAFGLKALSFARRCVFIDVPLLHYRRDNPDASTQSADKVFTVADEFAEARQFIKRDEELYRKLIAYIRLDEWRTHRWDSTRVSPEARADYFERVRAEFLEAQRAEELDETLFEPAEWERLQTLLAAPERPAGFDPSPAQAAIERLPLNERAAHVSISIVIAAHNSAEFVDRAIRSCRLQTHCNIEIICVDDGSSDETAQIMRSHARADTRVKVLSLFEHGLTHNARFAGIRRATGRLVTFLDADDELAANACERIAREFARDPFDILQFGIRVQPDGVVDAREVRAMQQWCTPHHRQLHGREILVEAFSEFSYAANLAGKAFKCEIARAAFESLGAVTTDFGEDQMEYFAIACRSETYRGLRYDKLYTYHFGDGHSSAREMTAAQFERQLRGFESLRGIRDYLERAKLYEELGSVFEVHQLGQVNVALRTIIESVRAQDKGECYKRVSKAAPVGLLPVMQ